MKITIYLLGVKKTVNLLNYLKIQLFLDLEKYFLCLIKILKI